MAVQGPIPLEHGHAFPHGAFVHGEVEPLRDFERSTPERFVQATDKHSGELVWSVTVIDADPQAREKSLRVKVAASHQPVPPEAAAGVPFRPVEFDGLTVTPYVNSSGRLAYSLRATAMRAPSVKASTANGASSAQGPPAGAEKSSSPSGSSSKQAA